MRMWEIRENDGYRNDDMSGYKFNRRGYMEPKDYDKSYEEGYECGYEDGYMRGKKEASSSSTDSYSRRMR